MIVPLVGARYERVSWPASGGAGDQDAWLTQALEHLRLGHNAMLREHQPRAPKAETKGRQTRAR
ncbi:MAG TPA: hypothetical protein VNR64_07640 [Vicinamibacterales bacterium]|nr:hypothetical protein [Vicinamibacterales bacterium]